MSLIVSEGGRSTHQRIRLPRYRRVQVGSGIPGASGELRIRRLDDRAGATVRAAVSDELSVIWATPHGPRLVPVSIVEAARTRSAPWSAPPDSEVGVGDVLSLDGGSVEVVGVRARGRTWKRPGDRFPADEVQRVYARRASPPAGSSDWRRVRFRPSSPTSARSRASRSRSGPGRSTARTVPRVRNAAGGAAVHRVSPS